MVSRFYFRNVEKGLARYRALRARVEVHGYLGAEVPGLAQPALLRISRRDEFGPIRPKAFAFRASKE